MGEEVKGLRSTNWQSQNSYGYGNVKYSTGNAVAKELIHMIHGHEQWWDNCLRAQGVLGGWHKGGKLGQL